MYAHSEMVHIFFLAAQQNQADLSEWGANLALAAQPFSSSGYWEPTWQHTIARDIVLEFKEKVGDYILMDDNKEVCVCLLFCWCLCLQSFLTKYSCPSWI